MNDLAAIVEGLTEQAFVRSVLAPELASRGIHMWATLPGRIDKHGGKVPWDRIRRDIVRTLKERSGRFCTIVFDFYAMPNDWPGRSEASALPWEKRGAYVENALLEDLAEHMGKDFRQERFIPYVQVHEFEAILFSDVERLAAVLQELPGATSGDVISRLKAIVKGAAGGPEAINDNPNTAPSKRILSLVTGYRKPIHGVIAAQRIQLSTMRASCPNFGRWLTRLEALSQ